MIHSICVTVICACLLASAERTEDANSENGEELLNRETRSTITISAEVGKNVILPCNSDSSKDNKVTWMDPKRRLLSVNDQMTINDARMYIDKPRLEDWNLGIYNARVADIGEYVCQINTEPIISHRVYLVVTEAQTQGDTCRECNAYGRSHPPNEEFTHRDGCREYHCDCECSGKWNCPDERVKDTCKPECGTCWAGGEIREGNTPFKFKEDCYLYDCFCKCDGDWNCPKEKSIDTCRTNTTTGCYYCDVYGKRYEGNSHFKHVNGCIEYDCTCKCDGGWDCPGDKAVDKCKINPSTDCTRCQVFGQEYEGNTYFKYINGCIELTCGCNCDGSWSCPGENARDLCLTNQTTGCYYCDVYNYLYQGNSQFPLVQDCYKYSCDCACDGGWTCKHSIGKYVCDQFGKEPQDCNTCSIDGNVFRGDSRFFYQRGCVKYMCTCDCEGRYLCSGSDAHITCENADIEYIVSLRSGAMRLRTEHTRGPRQINENCIPCLSDGKTYAPYERFSKQVKCNTFSCTCGCNGLATCPPETAVYNCEGPSSSGRRVSTVTTQTGRDNVGGSGVSTCRDCTYLGATYEGGSPFEFERGCFRYHCNCNCDGSFECLSEDSEYICPGREECLKCDVSETAGEKQLIEPNTDFELRRGCILYDKCRCNCDGGWSCGDGQYTCDLCQGCKEGGNRYPGNSTFQMAKGCDLYTNCFCGCDGKWTCSGEGITDLCPTCRKCKIGTEYYDGGTSFSAPVKCTTYRECDCRCDGTYSCRRGIYTCDNRGNQPVEGRCTDCVHGQRRFRPGQSFDYTSDCSSYRDCECKCGTTHCREVEDTCGTCRTCQLDDVEYPGGTKFSSKTGCTIYKECDCFCNGTWKCYGGNVIDTCNECRKCNVDGDVYEPYSRFTMDRKCWKYQCFCACDGSTRCPVDMVINTCVTPDRCNMCEVDGRQIRGNTHFSYDLNDMTMSCRCNCDGSYVCIAEWLYRPKDASISGSGIGSGAESCLSCIMDGRSYRGGNNYTISRYGVNMNCQCNCNGGYYCYGTVSFEGAGCRRCSVYQHRYDGDSNFAVVLNGFRLACRCNCDGSYVCLGSGGSTVISCVNGIGCLPSTCGRCVIDGVVFNGGDQFDTIYNGRQLTCDCGCDGSNYCEGSDGTIISCVGGRCTELDCGSCNVFGNFFKGNSNFDLIYKGLKLTCQCQCGGNYRCVDSAGTRVVYCRDGGKGCLPQTCDTCMINGERYAGGSTAIKDTYNGVDVMCSCGCDGSVVCTGVTTTITLSCIGGKCSPIGCESCRVFGREYDSLSKFEIIYAGIKLNCQCECSGGYLCTGSTRTTTVECRDSRGCPPQICNTCSFNGREYRGLAVFKHSHHGIDFSCTCGCDGNVICQGVTQLSLTCRDCDVSGRTYKSRSTFSYIYEGIDMKCSCGCDGSSFCEGVKEVIEVSCIGDRCLPRGCLTCSIFGQEYQAISKFNIIYQGVRLNCRCSCDSSYVCTGSTGEVVVVCTSGSGCLPPPCRDCVVDGRRYNSRSTFPHVYKGIDMKCTCGCDGTSFCEGVTEVNEISCIGESCSPRGCRTCNIFGQEYRGDSNFALVYKGVKMQCECNCDTSYKCEGFSSVLECGAGKSCVPNRCRLCRVNGGRYEGGSTFEYDYKGVLMSCVCGCDGSYYCEGKNTDIELSCQRRGDCNQIGGCSSCSIFGQKYAGESRTDFVYQGNFMTCSCDCDSSYTCTGVKDNVVITCPSGLNCLTDTCGTCRIDRNTFVGMSEFDTVYKGHNFRCTCGCDGSYYCRSKDDGSEISCDIRGTCTQIGCNECISDNRRRQADEEFEKIYDGIQMNCLCACDGSYRCQGAVVKITIACTGDACSLIGCRSCIVDGHEYASGSDYEMTARSMNYGCRCECDGQSTCSVVEKAICKSCDIDGVTYKGHTRNRVYRGTQPFVCDCYCSGESKCTPEHPVCRECTIGSQQFAGNTNFEAAFDGLTFQCTCNCQGGYVCKSDSRTCTSESGCVDTCLECTIENRKHAGNTNFETVVGGILMKCRCDCSGGYECTSDTRRCTSTSGCVNICRECVIENRKYAGNTNFEAVVQGSRMQCSCDCLGGYTCTNEIRTCTSVSGCIDTCRKCIIDNVRYDGNTRFQAVLQGFRMDCSCYCSGLYECHNDTTTCTYATGCVDTCRGCEIEGNQYKGNTQFDLFHNAYGIHMNCECKCGGSYTCRGKKKVTSCVGADCPDSGCNNCVVDGKTYVGNSRFDPIIDGIKMTCTCSCDGGYKCVGKQTTTTCTGPGCVADINCSNCVIAGNTYAGNSEFQLDKNDGRMKCYCMCDGSFTCRGEKTTTVCIGAGCDGKCSSCNIYGRIFKGNTRFETVEDGIQLDCKCHCDGGYKCEGTFTQPCTGPECATTGCRRCIIDEIPYTGNTRFDIRKSNIDFSCTCYCDGSYTCKGSTDSRSSGSTYKIRASSSTESDGSAESVSGGESSSRYSYGQEAGASTSSGSSSGSSRSSSTSQDSSSESGISYGTSSGDGTSYGTSGTAGGRCRDCVVNGEVLSGGRDFTFRSGCTEYLCECFCNGSYVCPPERSTNFCEDETRTRDRSGEATGCTVGNRTYKTKLFSFTENCLKYICHCYDNGSYKCDSKETKRVC